MYNIWLLFVIPVHLFAGTSSKFTTSHPTRDGFCDGIYVKKYFVSSRKSNYNDASKCCHKIKSDIFRVNDFKDADNLVKIIRKNLQGKISYKEFKFWIRKDSKFRASKRQPLELQYGKTNQKNQLNNKYTIENDSKFDPYRKSIHEPRDKCQSITWRLNRKNKTDIIHVQWAHCEENLNQFICALPPPSSNNGKSDKDQSQKQKHLLSVLYNPIKLKSKTLQVEARTKRDTASESITLNVRPEDSCHMASLGNGLYISAEKMSYKSAHLCCLSKTLQPLPQRWFLSQENWTNLMYALYYQFHEHGREDEIIWAYARQIDRFKHKNKNIICTAAYLENGDKLVTMDVPCWTANRVICQNTESESAICQSIQYQDLGGGSYLLSDKRVTHTGAYACCRQKNMTLVNLYSPIDTRSFHRTVLPGGTKNEKMLNIWTAGVRKLRTDYFTWSDRQKYSLKENRDFCLAAVEIFGKNDFMLIDLGCERKLQFVCMGIVGQTASSGSGIDIGTEAETYNQKINYQSALLSYNLNENVSMTSKTNNNKNNHIPTTQEDENEEILHQIQTGEMRPTQTIMAEVNTADNSKFISIPIIDNATTNNNYDHDDTPTTTNKPFPETKQIIVKGRDSAEEELIVANNLNLLRNSQPSSNDEPNNLRKARLIPDNSRKKNSMSESNEKLKPKTRRLSVFAASAHDKATGGNGNAGTGTGDGDGSVQRNPKENITKENNEISIDVDGNLSWQDGLKLQLINMKNNFRTKNASSAITWKEKSEWRGNIIDEIAHVFLKICTQEIEKSTDNFRSFVHVMQGLNAVYQNSLKTAGRETFTWKMIRDHLVMCGARNFENCDNKERGDRKTCIENYKPIVPFAKTGKLKHQQPFTKQVDPIIDSLWWMTLTAMSTCFGVNSGITSSNTPITESDFKEIIERDFFDPLRDRWQKSGRDLQYYGSIIGDFDLEHNIKTMQYCAQESSQLTEERKHSTKIL